MLLKYSKLAKNLELHLVKVELEIRFKISKPDKFYNYNDYTITYYRNLQYPNITFRSYDNINIESKELVERTRYKNTNLYLSIEQENVEIKVVKTGLVRNIKRVTIQKNPLVEIIYENGEYTMEIEFDINNYKEVDSIIKKYQCKWWPSNKPLEISLLSLSRKLSSDLSKWCFSHKADGLHIMIFDDIIVYDNGNEIIPNNPNFVYEGEIIDNKKWIFDCLVYKGKNISKLPYYERWKYINDKNKKPIYIFNNLEELRSWCFMPTPFKADGYIISSNKKVYKSKWISTIDLRYNNGGLYLGDNTLWNYTDLKLNNDSIYEFEGETLKLVCERKDKNVANYKWVGESNQLYKYANGIGIPSIRVAHNKLKLKMLEYMKSNTLLDIGSGKGGDYDKWIHLGYKKIYALDPNLLLRKHHNNIIEIRESTKNLNIELNYDAISIFFVPWDDSFIKYILKAKYFAISYMIPPEEDINLVYSIVSNKNKVNISIPNSSTAENIVENRTNYEEIFNKYLSDWTLKEFKIDIYKECIEYNLITYYKHYVFIKKE